MQEYTIKDISDKEFSIIMNDGSYINVDIRDGYEVVDSEGVPETYDTEPYFLIIEDYVADRKLEVADYEEPYYPTYNSF